MAPGCAKTGGVDTNFGVITFLHGPRSCIGQDFARAEFACLLACWAGKFSFSFADDNYEVELPMGGISAPKGLKVRLEVIDGW